MGEYFLERFEPSQFPISPCLSPRSDPMFEPSPILATDLVANDFTRQRIETRGTNLT